ncbi:MAG: hypothetical protein KGQ59_05775, partial [Bdellovibrionales bacterium]|nr:hypothetical protein [Bdellovibrionales bacterium]
FVPIDFLWSGPPSQWITVAQSSRAQSMSYRAADYPAFEKQGDQMLMKILALQGVRSPERLILSSDFEAGAHAELKPLNTSAVGLTHSPSGPNDGAVILLGHQLLGLSDAEGQAHELAIGVGLFQRAEVYDSKWEALNAFDEALRNVVASGGSVSARDSIAGVGIHWFGPQIRDDAYAASDIQLALEGVRDSALAMDLPVLTMNSTFSDKIEKGFIICQAIAQMRSRRRARSADFKYSGDIIYSLGPEVLSLLGSRFATVFGCSEPADSRENPDWSTARKIYSWFAGAQGKEQQRIRSVHDISDGGLITAVAESCFARRLGATLRMPVAASPEVWAFGEGFHRFLVTCSDSDSTILESEWDSMGIPFQQVGVVSGSDRLEVLGCWSMNVSDLYRTWRGDGAK